MKAAHRMLVKVWHPDRFAGDKKLADAAGKKLEAINAAYSYLHSHGFKKPRRQRRAAVFSYGYGQNAQGTAHARSSRTDKDGGLWVQSRGRWFPGSAVLVRFFLAVCVVAAFGFLLKEVDSYLLSDPTTGRFYGEYRTQITSHVGGFASRIWNDVSHRVPSSGNGTRNLAPAESLPESEPAPAPEPSDTHRVAKAKPATVRLLPYITLGLTKDEVVEAEGNPTESSADTFVYGKSVLFFKDGRISGWKIDPKSRLRVKLWPDGPVDTSLRYFTIGSSRNEVLAVQGTPTSFSKDKFDYGESVVYFRNGHVVNWKNDLGSIPLRAIAR